MAREYPEGRLGADDEGTVQVAVMADEQHSLVRIEFAEPCAWLAVSPAQAVQLAEALLRKARQSRGVNSCGNTVAGVECTTLGWRATCGCGCEETVPAVCYDPFMGSGTVAAVAARLGRNYSGSELNESYLNDQARPRIQAAEHGMGIEEVEQGQKTLFK